MKLPHSIVLATALTFAVGCSATSGAHVASSQPASPPTSTPTPTPSVTATPMRSAPPGPLLKKGSHGHSVTQLETWLYQNKRSALYDMGCSFDDSFGPHLRAALVRWQQFTGKRPSGTIRVGSDDWQHLKAEATAGRLPQGIDHRSVAAAVRKGWAIDASKSPSCVRILKADASQSHGVSIVHSTDVSYGGYIDGKFRPTNDGVYHTLYKEGPDYKSVSPGNPWNGAPMPWAVFFTSDGDALHYDGLGPSHGCIHIPSWSLAKYIHDLPLGITVVVHG